MFCRDRQMVVRSLPSPTAPHLYGCFLMYGIDKITCPTLSACKTLLQSVGWELAAVITKSGPTHVQRPSFGPE